MRSCPIQAWLKHEFGWSYQTARRYINVATSFQSLTLRDGGETITIEATALYALAAPDVPQMARYEAVSRAEDGERITKAEAKKIIATAARAAKTRLRESAKATFHHLVPKVLVFWQIP